MTLPDQICVRVTAGGVPVSGMFIDVRVKMNRKNDYDLVFGPSDENGEITVARADLIREAQQLANFFIMDYVNVDGPNAGDVLVTMLDLPAIERAINAYETFAPSGVSYPPNWKEHLLHAREKLKSSSHSVRAEVQFEV